MTKHNNGNKRRVRIDGNGVLEISTDTEGSLSVELSDGEIRELYADLGSCLERRRRAMDTVYCNIPTRPPADMDKNR